MKIRKDKNFLWKFWNLCLVVGGLVLVAIGIITIIRKILEGNPAYDQNAIIDIIIGLDVSIASFLWASMPITGVVGDERTKRAAEKASLYAFLILVGCLLLLGIVNSFWQAIKDLRLMPFIIAHIGIYSWGILTYYFDKKGDV